MLAEVVAVGTELLLGDVVDTNSAWIGRTLALAGVDVHHHSRVGDNVGRIADVLRLALGRADAVVVCGGLGPTPDDVTREALAEVMGVGLVRDAEVLERIRALFARQDRAMSPSNERQADVPTGARAIEQRRGTAPGLICPVGDQVVYAVPGVPHEMTEMVDRAVVPDLQARMGGRAAIVSRVLHTWGLAESSLADRLAPRLEALDGAGNPTIAFLAGGTAGVKVRITAKAGTAGEAEAILDAEEVAVRSLLGRCVFAVGGTTMESVVGGLLQARQLRLGVAESMTGGMIASRCTEVPGSSSWFRGGIVSYASEVKFDVLGVPQGPVVCSEAATAMALGARRILGADVGLSVTGVAGPEEQDGRPVGTVFVGLALGPEDADAGARCLRLAGDRASIRQMAAVWALDHLRLELQPPPI
ncbi:MAG TPA: competence/damage-inducible protein A [Acidimicrobiales bacterium]|nr:competence/damage-inducible protein A [Acidimicrobiales bacterium]